MLRFVFMLLVTIGSAQAAYITDKLLVGFYAKPEATSQPVKVLPSSTPMEVLGKQGALSKVRLGDGKEGWVKSIYISTEKPARAMLLELQAKSSTIQNKLLQAEKALKAAKAGAAAPADNKAIAKLEQELALAKKQLETVNSALKNEQNETRQLVARLKKAGSNGAGSQSKQVRELKKKLSSSEAELKATLHEARLLQELLKKTDQTASQRIAALEAEVRKARQNQASASSAAMKQQNAILKQRLQQLGELLLQSKYCGDGRCHDHLLRVPLVYIGMLVEKYRSGCHALKVLKERGEIFGLRRFEKGHEFRFALSPHKFNCDAVLSCALNARLA